MLRAGRTLVEMLVVIAVLAGVLLSAVQQVRAATARVRCANNMRQVALGSAMYHDTHAYLPAPSSRAAGERYPQLGWLPRLLPYLDQTPAWDRTESDYARSRRPLDQTAPHANVSMVLSILGCPADARTGTAWLLSHNGWHMSVAVTSYLGNAGTQHRLRDGVIVPDGRVPLLGIEDGTSNTVLVFERPPSG